MRGGVDEKLLGAMLLGGLGRGTSTGTTIRGTVGWKLSAEPVKGGNPENQKGVI